MHLELINRELITMLTLFIKVTGVLRSSLNYMHQNAAGLQCLSSYGMTAGVCSSLVEDDSATHI